MRIKTRRLNISSYNQNLWLQWRQELINYWAKRTPSILIILTSYCVIILRTPGILIILNFHCVIILRMSLPVLLEIWKHVKSKSKVVSKYYLSLSFTILQISCREIWTKKLVYNFFLLRVFFISIFGLYWPNSTLLG